MKLRVYYKHSKRIAKEALKAGLIKEKLYKELYTASFKLKKKRKRPEKEWPYNSYFLYYKELFYLETDYWGEHDEISIIDDIQQKLFWSLNLITSHGALGLKREHFLSTLAILKVLKEYKASKKTWEEFIKAYIYRKYLAQKKWVEQKRLNDIPECKSYFKHDSYVSNFDCGYGADFDCMECICNGGIKDPREDVDKEEEILFA